MSLKRTRLLLSSVVAVLAVSLSACGSDGGHDHQSTTPADKRTPATVSPTSAQAQALPDEHIDLDDAVVSGPLLLSGETKFSINGVFGVATVHNPGKSTTTLDAATLLPGEEIESQSWAGAGTLDKPKALGAIVIRQPAAQLDPAHWEARIITVNPTTGSVEKSVTYLKSNAKIDESQIGVSSGPIVPIVYADASQPSGNVYYARYQVIGVDTGSGNVTWKSDGIGRAASPETIAIERAGSSTPGRDRCARVGVVRVSDGTWLGHMDQGTMGPNGCDGQFNYQYSGGAVIGVNRNEKYGQADRRIPYTAFDQQTGAKLSVPDAVFTLTDSGWLPTVEYNVPGGIAAYQLRAGEEIVSFDVRDGRTLFSLDQDRAKSLNAELKGIVGHNMIVKTTDQLLYVDVNSGHSQTTAPPATALAHVAGNWTLFTDGTLTNSLIEIGKPR
ncbi:hypothetical protein [Gordonia sp. i37]|uniref:hypothetical protein n=1 Tax=Gordonia sp. i37 TaxID=1961707 RepID=UPI0009AD3393|nr:hypothetical protein [Gordonia sp. i37]OPX16230.1 hypothetical protein B1964_05870 [Gordonia sp. i37]